MSHGYGGPNLYKIVKYEQPVTGFGQLIPLQFGIRSFFKKIQFGLRRVKLRYEMLITQLSTQVWTHNTRQKHLK